MKKWFFGERKYIDEEKVKQEKQDLVNVRWLLDYGTAEEFTTYARGMNPNMTEEQIKVMLDAFYEQRDARQRQRHLQPPQQRGV